MHSVSNEKKYRFQFCWILTAFHIRVVAASLFQFFFYEHWIPTIQMQKLLIFCHICSQHFNTIFKHRWLVKSSARCWDPHCTMCTFPVIGTSSLPNILKCPVTTAFFSYTELKSAFLEFLPIYSTFALWKDVVKIVSFFFCLAALKTLKLTLIGDHLRYESHLHMLLL